MTTDAEGADVIELRPGVDLYVACEDMIAEVRRVAPGLPCKVDPLMSPWSWRIGAYE